MKPAVVLLLLSVASLAGCAEEGSDGGDVVATPQYEDEVVQVSAPIMPRDPPAAGERTLDAVPQWRLGEWWTYTMTDGFTGGTYEFTRVVAGEDRHAGNYLVGFPLEEFSNDVMLFHIPGYGDIAQADLSYETHDAVFQPLDFPLTEGKHWQTEFEGTGLGDAFVLSAAGGKAEVNILTGGGFNITATYDADVGEITEMEVRQGDGLYARYSVTGHGYDYRGVVRVPHAHDLVFIHGRAFGTLNAGAGDPTVPGTPLAPVPTETVVVDAGFDRVSFIIAVGGGAFTGLPATVGAFRESVTAPDDTVYEATWTPADIPTSGMLKIVAVGHDSPEGTWTLQHAAAGAGVAFVEGIGYHSIDIELPSGCVIASFNAQHHNADCKVAAPAGNATA